MPLSGILPVIPTPFVDGRFDETSFGRFLDHIQPSVDGFVILGSTGEAPSLELTQRMAIAERVLQMADPEMTVVVGVTSTCQADSVHLSQHAQSHGAAGVLCASPFYFPNSPDGILRYLTAVDDALEIELVFYDNPAATKTMIAAVDVVHWAEQLEHLETVKLTDHDLSKIAIWQQAGLTVFAGDDPIAMRYLRAGVDGVMIIAPAVFPEEFRQVWDLCQAGRYDDAVGVFGRVIAPFSHVFGIGDEIATTKALLASIGIFDSAEVLPPLLESTADRLALLQAAYRLGIESSGVPELT